MNRGKVICKELKEVRRKIAEENDIPLEIPECTYEGPCRGTCPRCESEVRFLENALADRLRLGTVATVAGLALTLGVTGSAAAQSTEVEKVPPSHERQTGDCEVTGVVVDARTHEPLPFAQVMLYQDTAQAMVVQTDFDGRYRFSVHRGKYTLVVRGVVGYNEYRREVRVTEFWKVDGCPLAATLRKRMRKQKRFPERKFQCVWSPERNDDAQPKGTLMPVTATFGLTLASLVIKDIIKGYEPR